MRLGLLVAHSCIPHNRSGDDAYVPVVVLPKDSILQMGMSAGAELAPALIISYVLLPKSCTASIIARMTLPALPFLFGGDSRGNEGARPGGRSPRVDRDERQSPSTARVEDVAEDREIIAAIRGSDAAIA